MAELTRVVGEENYFDRREDIIAWTRTRSPGGEPLAYPLPEALLRPGNLEECAKILRVCATTGLSTRFRGFGSGVFPEPKKPYVIILTERLNRIIDVDPVSRRIRVQAGALIPKITAKIAERGLWLPALSGIGTLGGRIVGNGSSRAALKYGNLSSYIVAFEIVTGEGERIICAGNEETAFPSGASLFCGSRGTLGLVGSVEARLLPLPQKRVSILATFSDAKTAAEAAVSLLAASFTPTACELVDNLSGAAPNLPAHAMLALEFDGEAETAERERAESGDFLVNAGCREILLNPAEWPIKTADLPVSLAAGGRPFRLVSAAFPPARLPEFIRGVVSIVRERELDAVIYGSPGSAAMTAALFYGAEREITEAERLIFALELVLNDNFISEKDLEQTREERKTGAKALSAARALLRRAFDPRGILSDPGLF